MAATELAISITGYLIQFTSDPFHSLALSHPQGYEGSLLKVTSKNGKTASVSVSNIPLQWMALLHQVASCRRSALTPWRLCSCHFQLSSRCMNATSSRGVRCTNGRRAGVRADFIDTKINSNFLLPPITCSFPSCSLAARRFRYIPHSCRCRSSQARSTGNLTSLQPI